MIKATPVRFLISVDPNRGAAVETEKVNRAIAKDLVSDMAISDLGVVSLWSLHDGSLRIAGANNHGR